MKGAIDFTFKVDQGCRPLRAVLYLKKDPVLKIGLYNYVERISRVDAEKLFEGELVSRIILPDDQEGEGYEYFLRLYSAETPRLNVYAMLPEGRIHVLATRGLRLSTKYFLGDERERVKGAYIENGQEHSLRRLLRDVVELALRGVELHVEPYPHIKEDTLSVRFEEVLPSISEKIMCRPPSNRFIKGSGKGLELSSLTLESYLEIPDDLSRYLYGRPITLFKVQADALNRLDSGENVLLAAGTGAGKTEVGFLYFLKRSIIGGAGLGLFIYPTNALLNNQFNRAMRMANWFNDVVVERLNHAKIKSVEVAKLCQQTMKKKDMRSGEGYEKIRHLIREGVSVFLMTNAQFCISLLDSWEDYFADIPIHLVAFDEFQFYNTRSLLALAHLVMRRFRRHVGDGTRFLVSSATIANPEALKPRLEALLGGEFIPLTSPRRQGDKRVYLLYLSPHADREQVAAEIIEKLFKESSRRGRELDKTICYVWNRNACDRIYFYLPSEVRKFVKRHYSDLSSYERSQIEGKFLEGAIRCLLSTRTLEVGIDIGDVSRVIHVDIPPSVADIAQREGRMGRTGQECESIFLISSQHEEKLVKDYLKKLEQARSLEAESIGGRIYLDIDGIIPKIIRCFADMKDNWWGGGRECERLAQLLKQLFGKAKMRLRPSIYGRLIRDDQPELWRVKVLGEDKAELNEREIRLYDVVIRYQKNFIHSPSRSRKYVVVGFKRDDRGRWLVLLERYSGEADVSTTLFSDSFVTPPSLDQYIPIDQGGGQPLESQLFLVERRPIMIKHYRIIRDAAYPLKKVSEFDLSGEEHYVYRDLYEGFYFKLYFPTSLNYLLLYQACHYALHILLNRLAEELDVRYSEFFDFIRIPPPEGIAAIKDLLDSQVKEAEVVICDQSGLLANNIFRLRDICERTIREFDPRLLTPLCESYNCPIEPLIGEDISQEVWGAVYAVLNALYGELDSRLGLVKG